MVMTTLPAFTFQIRRLPLHVQDLFEMTMSFRPRRWTLLALIVPTIAGHPTAWKVNLGNAARVVVVANCRRHQWGPATSLRQQQLFDMAGAIAWTLQLVLFVLVVQQTINAIEGWCCATAVSSARFRTSARPE
jgi:ABC-type nitrate/sulfonate/bicarbonate transport system permease component